MGEPRPTREVEAVRSDDEVLAMARKRLRLALEMLGDKGAETVLDDSLTGAGVLARDAGDLLEVLFERRLEGG